MLSLATSPYFPENFKGYGFKLFHQQWNFKEVWKVLNKTIPININF